MVMTSPVPGIIKAVVAPVAFVGLSVNQLPDTLQGRLNKDMSNPSNPYTYLIRSLIFGLAGMVLLAIAGSMAYWRYEFLPQAQHAPGVVTKLNAGGSHPEIEFTSADNQVISYPQGGMISGYEVGQPVQVLYLAEDPEMTAVIEDRGALWGTPVMLGIMGLAFIWGCRSEFSSGRKQPAVPPLKGR